MKLSLKISPRYRYCWEEAEWVETWAGMTCVRCQVGGGQWSDSSQLVLSPATHHMLANWTIGKGWTAKTTAILFALFTDTDRKFIILLFILFIFSWIFFIILEWTSHDSAHCLPDSHCWRTELDERWPAARLQWPVSSGQDDCCLSLVPQSSYKTLHCSLPSLRSASTSSEEGRQIFSEDLG